jgi:tyrosyl-tRNA synthetase
MPTSSNQGAELLSRLEEHLLHPLGDLRHLSAEEQFDIIQPRVAPGGLITSRELLERLKSSKASGQPLRVKFGIDPTGPDIHIGHAVSLINLRLFRRMGHQIVLVIGDFTAQIGDPSGRSDERPALTLGDVRDNMATYEAQAARVVDLADPSIERHYNSEWMSRLTMQQWADLLRKISASSLLQRDDFRQRLASGQGLSMAELEYALYMAYDSVILNPDIELGGTDQFLNFHMCRQMMKENGQVPEVIIAFDLIPGTTGERDSNLRFEKMSKSRGNYIAVTAEPADMYGKVMSIPDEVMWIWYRSLTEAPAQSIHNLETATRSGHIHPKDAKQLLARVVVATFNRYSATAIEKAERDFNSKFGAAADLVPEGAVPFQANPDLSILNLLSSISGRSKGEVRRLCEQRGIWLLGDGGTEYINFDVSCLGRPGSDLRGAVVRIGKRHYYRAVS